METRFELLIFPIFFLTIFPGCSSYTPRFRFIGILTPPENTFCLQLFFYSLLFLFFFCFVERNPKLFRSKLDVRRLTWITVGTRLREIGGKNISLRCPFQFRFRFLRERRGKFERTFRSTLSQVFFFNDGKIISIFLHKNERGNSRWGRDLRIHFLRKEKLTHCHSPSYNFLDHWFDVLFVPHEIQHDHHLLRFSYFFQNIHKRNRHKYVVAQHSFSFSLTQSGTSVLIFILTYLQREWKEEKFIN